MIFPLTSRGPDDLIAFRNGGFVSVEALMEESAQLSRHLRRGSHAINLHDNRYDYLRGFCAAMIAGHCTLMPPNRQPETLRDLERHYPNSYRIGGAWLPELPAVESDEDEQSAVPISVTGEQVAVVAFTSGSTGEATPTAKSWRTLQIGTENNRRSLLGKIGGRVHAVATVPPQHMWGFETSILLPLYAAMTISEKFPIFPADIADSLAELPEPRVLISSPLHLRTLMKSGIETPPLRRVLTATAPMSAEEAIDFEAYFGAEVLDVFGCSESGVFATRRPARESNWTLTPPFKLEHSQHETLIHAEHLPGPVHLPDVVEPVSERTFRWLGRSRDMINIAGKRGSLVDLNRRLLAIEDVIDGVIFQPRDNSRLAALVVAPGLQASQLTRTLKNQIDPVFLPRPMLMVEALPRQETGKLPRSTLLEFYESLRRSRPGRKNA